MRSNSFDQPRYATKSMTLCLEVGQEHQRTNHRRDGGTNQHPRRRHILGFCNLIMGLGYRRIAEIFQGCIQGLGDPDQGHCNKQREPLQARHMQPEGQRKNSQRRQQVNPGIVLPRP